MSTTSTSSTISTWVKAISSRRCSILRPNWKQEGLITVSTYNDYLAQIRYGEPIAVLTRIEKVGNKSFTLFQQIVNTATQEVKTQSRSVLVAFDFVAQVSIPLLEPWRKSFGKQL